MALLSRPHHPSKGAPQVRAEATLPAANPLPEKQAARNCSAAPRAWPFDLRNPRFNGSSVAAPAPPPVSQQAAHLSLDSAGSVRLHGAMDTQTDTQTRATSAHESGTQQHAEQHGVSSAGHVRDPPAVASSWTPESGKETGKEPGQETGIPASQQTALAPLPNGVAPPDNFSAQPLLSPYINGGPATPSTASAPGAPPLQTELSYSVCHIMCTRVIDTPHMLFHNIDALRQVHLLIQHGGHLWIEIVIALTLMLKHSSVQTGQGTHSSERVLAVNNPSDMWY